jgi:hypothetical protein
VRQGRTQQHRNHNGGGSFTEQDLDAEPNGPDKTADDDGNDGLEGVALHAAEDDEPVAGRFDLVAENPELVAEAKGRDLAFDQPLARLCQRALRLANAHRQRAALDLAGLDQKLAEEVRFPRASAAVYALVARGHEQWLEDFSCRNFQGGQ